ncbi:MAG TPA: hypothetical protein DEB31_02540 [Clostridiales bacterium]|nr:hypothetical protein [Clostridiales bacterium]
MSLLNAFLIFLIIIYILQGLHKGFLVSVGNTIGMAVSWLVGYLFGPVLSETIAGGSFYNFLRYFTEGSARIANQADGNLVVSELTSRQVDTIVSGANMPYPFNELVRQNMNDLVFTGQDNIVKVSDYFDYTVANVVVNILAFLIIYCIARVIIALMLNAVNFASPLPVLKRCDMLAGGGVGMVRGYFGMFALMMLVPVVLISAPVGVDLFSDLVSGSPLATYFFEHNFLLDFIPGTIGG